MRKLILKMSITIDGFVCGPNGEMDWLFKSSNEASRKWTYDIIAGAGVHIMGSRTFYDMRAYWPTSSDMFAGPMNDIPKVVFTRKGLKPYGGTTNAIKDATAADKAEGLAPLQQSDKAQSWINATVAQGDMVEEIKKLKAQPGNHIMAHGGAGFARSLIKTGLVDQFCLAVHPFALGQGMPIFSELDSRITLRLVSSTAFETGTLGNIYLPVGGE